MIKQINICLNNTIRKIYNEEIDYNNDLLNQINTLIINKFDIDTNKNSFFLKDKELGCLINNSYLSKLDPDRNVLDIEVIFRLKGGIIDTIVNMLRGIIKMFMSLYKILEQFAKLFIFVMTMIPLVLDPPALMNDIMFAVTFGINKVFEKVMESVKGESVEDEDEGKGPFNVKNSDNIKCMDPSFTTILLLIICPPLAIFFKLGFLKGFVSAIICGVLCVKLYYFPGLLFAILHVLC